MKLQEAIVLWPRFGLYHPHPTRIMNQKLSPQHNVSKVVVSLKGRAQQIIRSRGIIVWQTLLSPFERDYYRRDKADPSSVSGFPSLCGACFLPPLAAPAMSQCSQEDRQKSLNKGGYLRPLNCNLNKPLFFRIAQLTA